MLNDLCRKTIVVPLNPWQKLVIILKGKVIALEEFKLTEYIVTVEHVNIYTKETYPT